MINIPSYWKQSWVAKRFPVCLHTNKKCLLLPEVNSKLSFHCICLPWQTQTVFSCVLRSHHRQTTSPFFFHIFPPWDGSESTSILHLLGKKWTTEGIIFWKESDGVYYSVWLAKHVNSWLPSINKQYTFKGCAVFFPYKQKNQNVYVCEYVCLYCKRLGTQDWCVP